MKKMTALLLLMALLLCGCGERNTAFTDTVTFYYPRADIIYGSADGVIAPEEREASISGNPLEQNLSSYLSGPKAEGLENPFPPGTMLLSLRQEEGELTVVLSDAFFAMDGIELTVACASLAKTCFSLTEATEMTLCSGDNEERITINRESFLYFDESDAIEMTIGTEPAA